MNISILWSPISREPRYHPSDSKIKLPSFLCSIDCIFSSRIDCLPNASVERTPEREKVRAGATSQRGSNVSSDKRHCVQVFVAEADGRRNRTFDTALSVPLQRAVIRRRCARCATAFFRYYRSSHYFAFTWRRGSGQRRIAHPAVRSTLSIVLSTDVFILSNLALCRAKIAARQSLGIIILFFFSIQNRASAFQFEVKREREEDSQVAQAL